MAAAVVQPQLDFINNAALEEKLIPESRRTVYIRPASGDDFVARQNIRINIPNSQLADLQQTRLEMRIRRSAATGSANSFISESAWSVVRKAQVFSGDGSLLEEIDQINVLASVLHDLMPPDWRTSIGAVTMGIDSIAQKQVNFGNDGKLYSLDLSILGLFFSNVLLPSFALATQPYILLELASNAEALTDASAPGVTPTFQVDQVRLVLDMVDVPSAFKQAWLDQLAQGNSMRIPFESWQRVPESMDATQLEKNLKFGFFKSNLKGVMVVPRNQTLLNSTANDELSNRFFDSWDQSQVQLADRQFPEEPQLLTRGAPTAYAQLLKMVALHRSGAGNNIDVNYTSALGGTGNRFVLGFVLGCKNDSLGSCGINTKLNPASMNINLRRTAATAAVDVQAYGHHNASLEVSSTGLRTLD